MIQKFMLPKLVIPKLVPKISPLGYFARLRGGKIVLWCYLVWYLATVWHLWDPDPRLWLNAAGISLVIGFALLLSVAPAGNPGKRDPWQTMRLFAMPFCVSSFSSLIKNQGFVLVFPSDPEKLLHNVAACTLFLLCLAVLKYSWRERRTSPGT